MTKHTEIDAHSEHRMQCMELWGGAAETQTAVAMTGLDGSVFSRPYNKDSHGGDVYYFTSCASGRISRILLADVAGHGAAVADTSALLRSIMRRNVNVIGQSRLMSAINDEYCKVAQQGSFATAIMATYFEPNRSLSISAAGHPPPLVFRKSTGLWTVFTPDESAENMAAGLPLGITETEYKTQTIAFEPGDLLLAYTDAFSEASDEDGKLLQTKGLMKLMNSAPRCSPVELVTWLVSKVEGLSAGNLVNDDATAIMLQPTGDGIPMKNNLLAPLRMVRGVNEIQVDAKE